MRKILIIRFSSIGDIVLTSPIVRCIKFQMDSEVHYLTKDMYSSLIESNPYIDKVFTLKNNFKDIILQMKLEKYDFIIDLHNNMRSWWVRFNLRRPSSTVLKGNLEKFLLIYLNLNYLNSHIVDRYFNCLKVLNVTNDHHGLDFFLNKTTFVDFNVNQNFIAWSIGGSYSQKKLSKKQIITVCNNVSIPIILLGGIHEKSVADEIIQSSSHKSVFNFCGTLSLDQSAYLIKKSSLVLTNDTGLMHIAACFQKIIISFWGCTKPVLGFYPYMGNKQSVQLVSNPTLSPCSKHGNFCKLQKEGCVKQIKPKFILEEINKILLQGEQ